MHIVLVEPEIPQNTGNIARTCALTNTTLHLIRPLGFSLEDRYLKRAGLDYWDKVDLKLWHSFEELAGHYPDARFFLATTRTEHNYHLVQYPPGSFLVFGKETQGLPESILKAYPESHIRIPMRDIGRSLNLANSAAIVLYEALRQNNFLTLK